jgi:hypothetical protein
MPDFYNRSEIENVRFARSTIHFEHALKNTFFESSIHFTLHATGIFFIIYWEGRCDTQVAVCFSMNTPS